MPLVPGCSFDPVPGTFVFPRFAEIFLSLLQAPTGKATPVAPPSPGCVYTAVTPSSVLSWPQNTTPFTQPQLLNTQQRAPHPALALLTQSAGSWDGHCRAEGVSCSDSTLLPCVPGANPPAPFLGSTLGLPAAAPRGCECAPRLLPQGGDARGQCLVCGELWWDAMGSVDPVCQSGCPDSNPPAPTPRAPESCRQAVSQEPGATAVWEMQNRNFLEGRPPRREGKAGFALPPLSRSSKVVQSELILSLPGAL